MKRRTALDVLLLKKCRNNYPVEPFVPKLSGLFGGIILQEFLLQPLLPLVVCPMAPPFRCNSL